jgi:plasmid stability protein
MASLTIRQLDESIKVKLRIRAAEHGRSMEAEAREILTEAFAPKPEKEMHLVERIRRTVAKYGPIDLPDIPDEPVGDPIDFSGPEYDR